MTKEYIHPVKNFLRNPSVFTLILNFNNYADTVETIESVYASDYDPNTLILIENSTEKEIPRKIHERFPALEIIINQKNLGYAEGNNVGIEAALARGADYVFILNNDVILERDALTKCVDVMKRSPGCAACQPLIAFEKDRKMIWSAGTEFFLGYPRLFRKGQAVTRNGVKTPPFGLVGCAFLLRSSALREVGLFDTSLFLMHEETDWCIRASARHFSLSVITDAVACHKVSKTLGSYSREYLYYTGRNWLHVGKKNYGRVKYWYILATEITLRFPYYLCHLARNRQVRQVKYYLQGLIDGLQGISGEADFNRPS